MSEEQFTKKAHRIAEFKGPDGRSLFVLWVLDEDGAWVYPGAARTREGIRRLGETVERIGSLWDPKMPAAVAEVLREFEFVELDDATQERMSRELAVNALPAGEA